MPIAALTWSKRWGKSPKIASESGRCGQFIGLLDIGNDIGSFPEGVGGDLLQGDGPVALAVARHADDVEFDTAFDLPSVRPWRRTIVGVIVGADMVNGSLSLRNGRRRDPSKRRSGIAR